MIRGESVTVVRYEESDRDSFNAPVYRSIETIVDNVLVIPGRCADATASNRPDGIEIAYTLHFPKTFDGDLRGCSVKVRGGDPLRVVGHPERYTSSNTPGDWNMAVEVASTEG